MGNLPAGSLPTIDSAFDRALSATGRLASGFMGSASLADILNGTAQLPYSADLTAGGQTANPGSAPWADSTHAASTFTPPNAAAFGVSTWTPPTTDTNAVSTWTPPTASTNGSTIFTLGGTGGVYVATINARTLDVGFDTSIAQSCTDLAAVINSGGSFTIGAITGGPFQLGETVTSSSGGSATLTGIVSPLTVSGVTGTFHSTDLITGGTSLATATASQNLQIVSNVVTAVAGATTVTVTAKTPGLAGNGITTVAAHTGAATMTANNATTLGGKDTTVVIQGVSFVGNFTTDAATTVTAVKALIAGDAPTTALVATSGSNTLILTAKALGTLGNGAITTVVGGTATGSSQGSFSDPTTVGGKDTTVVINGVSFVGNFHTSAAQTVTDVAALIAANSGVSALVGTAGSGATLIVTAVAPGTAGNGITTTVGGTATGSSQGSFSGASTTGGNDTLCVIDSISFLATYQGSADLTLAALIPLIQANATVSALVTVANVSHQLVVTAILPGSDGNAITTTVGGTAHGASFNHATLVGGAGTTLNSVTGRVVMGTGNQYLILNNSLVGPNTIIQPTLETVDGTLTAVTPIPGSPGQVLFAGNATATGNTTISFTLINPLVG